ncbi:BRO family protein [uncultured Veillonella sp.]|uniref:BRO family protein n=1 Tax=uncultured Veillonella sp. TaxID=159268 RepID=UPI0028D57BAD|nr:BRO family protein [uncultured Veillonella sp.]
MELITTQHYGGNIFSFYSTKRKDIFMTINELATGFGYKSKKGIEEMLRRKPYLKENKYSFMSKVPVRNYGTPQSVGTTKSKLQYQEVRLFTERGIFEIGCISHTAKAEQFRDWVFNQLKILKDAFTKGMIAHTESKDLQKMLHDAVFNSLAYINKDDESKRKSVMNINKHLIKTASNGRVTHKVDMTAEEIQKLEHLEHKTITLLNEGKCYKEIKLAL